MTVMILPLAVIAKAGAVSSMESSNFIFSMFYHQPFALYLIIMLFMVGFLLGSERAIILLGYMWGTEKSAYQWIGILLWLCIFTLGYCSYKGML